METCFSKNIPSHHETTAVDNPRFGQKTQFFHFSTQFPALQQDHDVAATLRNHRWFSATAPFELHRAGLSEKLLLTSIAPAVWHTHESSPSGLGCSSHLRAVPGGKAGEVHFRSECLKRTGPPVIPTANC